MNLKKSLLLFFLVLTSFAYSQEAPNELVNLFFKNFESKGATFALDELYKTNKWISRSGDDIIQLKTQLEGLTDDYVGKLYGKELIVEKKLTQNFVLLSYLLRYDRQPIRFTFEFYKPNAKWKVFGFSFDGNLDDELEESAKLYHLKNK